MSATLPLSQVSDCWNRIGVWGDGSCPTLAEVIHCRNCPVYAAAGRALFEREAPPGYAEEWAERLAAADAPPPGETVPVVLFRVGAEWYALDVAVTVEVAPYRAVRRLPHPVDRVLQGLVNIRGELQVAVSFADLLDTGAAPREAPSDGGDGAEAGDGAGTRRLLVVEHDSSRWVFVADAVADLHYFPRAALTALPATVAAGARVFTRGVFDWDGHAVGYLDAPRLFAALRGTFR